LIRPSLSPVASGPLVANMVSNRLQSLHIDAPVEDEALMQSRFGPAALAKQTARYILPVVSNLVQRERASLRASTVSSNGVLTRDNQGSAGRHFSGKVLSSRASSHRRVFSRSDAASHIVHAFDSTIITNLLSTLSRQAVSPGCAIRKSLHAVGTMCTLPRKAALLTRAATHATFVSEVRTRSVAPLYP
jgi:hypothetical protein